MLALRQQLTKLTSGPWSSLSPSLSLIASSGVRRAAWRAASSQSAARSTAHAVHRLATAYRRHGHLKAQLDPLGIHSHPSGHCEVLLEPSTYGLGDGEVCDVRGVVTLSRGSQPADSSAVGVSDVVSHLRSVYCGSLAYEFEHVSNDAEREWLYEYVEGRDWRSEITPSQKRNMHSVMLQSEVFDHFMGAKFATFKRYGLEGAESVMAALQRLFERVTSQGVEDVVIGMPHRGRLNILVGLLDYPARALFHKVMGQSDIPEGMRAEDDVVSHIATSVDKSFDGSGNKLHVTMLHNPSHLEAVNPVSQGKTRAKRDVGRKSLNVQLHGDAAFAGQGIVPESFGLMNLKFFSIGGTIHIICNNQIGFTTQGHVGRSTLYSSDIARFVDVPVVHVNGEDPEAVVHAMDLAAEYRHKFGKDIIVDIVGYRRHGHNEVDEPMFTQPRMYTNIRARPSIVSTYTQQLSALGLVNDKRLATLKERFNGHLEAEWQASKEWKPQRSQHFQGKWSDMRQAEPHEIYEQPDTGVAVDELRRIGVASVTVPDGFKLHSRLERMHQRMRLKNMESGKQIDWATAEALMFGSLLLDGNGVRVCGQDVERGTFSHRHGVVVDQDTEDKYCPLNRLGTERKIHFVSSPLTELAVLGFEYGYSIEDPRNLIIWEAQFGDFNNCAQTVIDTFVTSCESKWLRQSGIVMLLPHGFDGAGPEHSSCRIERFLQMAWASEFDDPERGAVDTNFIVANVTTPANYFHLLRRQQARQYRKPLVLAAAKTMLRDPLAQSTLDDMAPGTRFQPVIGEATPEKLKKKVSTVILCSGKVYYELVREREARDRFDVAIVRVEELNPFPYHLVREELQKCPARANIVWCQEEPDNAGAWSFVGPRIQRVLKHMGRKSAHVEYAGRAALPVPATGNGVEHKRTRDLLLDDAFRFK